MNNLPELPLRAPDTQENDPQAQSLPLDAHLEDYLEHLCAPLIGIVPYPERRAFRQEAHVHLDGLISECLWQGQDLQAATEAALQEFGEPWKVGQAFLREWLRGNVRQRSALLRRKATCTAFAWFGLASMLILLLLERAILVPGQEVLLPGIGLMAVVAPIIAGALTGAMFPVQAERGVRNAMLILILHSCVTGLLLQPRYEVMALAAWQLVFWLPAGRISAAFTAACRRQSRRQRFWQTAR